ncbi:Chemotaxis protein methyltransferase [Thalassovita gelatinovora]|uniref:Chemotaxis protein methyltransferase n=1 Tax=Thalassovita gelatinovora TaxID=53501 RepID=A0A0N7LV37_THAGE|nr:CheR family methyltransferase [Thalassovita gelatinovora]QIZ80650.1 methyltransferase domain-containing protein [Thalassovita gelatinovora]CUH65210.1 Chemotaxis protein methyltransferase [Thalassovita gelatinovora]SEQ87510.1 chemotaxis protein methyltransferase CheR [Thalassovita gelatinovora]
MSSPIIAADRELRAKLCAIVTEKTGIQLPENKSTMIEGRLRKRIRAVGVPDIRTYLKMVFDDGHLQSELPHIIDVLTTNKTDFFREKAHFGFMEKHILPNHPATRSFKFWSAASSSGEEAYTAAMTFAEHAKRNPGFQYSILGTDISSTVVTKARQAVYTREELVDIPQSMQDQYMEMGHSSNGRELARIVQSLRDKVVFAQMNLTGPKYPVDRNMDVIFLRNVLIYFDEAMQKKVVSNIADHVRPGGYLFVGHSESAVVTDPRLTQCAAAAFRKEVQ